MLTIEPPPFASMPGRKARMVRCIDLTLRSKEKSQSASEHSSTVPWCTKPAALSRISTVPARFAMASTAAVSRTSSFATLATPPLFNAARFSSSTSVANTPAPSRAKASAQARPMPTAAAVTNARLPFRRLDIWFLLFVVIPGRAPWREPGIHNPRSWLWIPGLRQTAHPGMTGCWSVIIPRHPDGAGDVVVAGGEFEAGAGGLLADIAAVQFLPGRLVLRIGEAAHRLQVRKAPLQLLLRDQDVGVALVEIDADAVAGLQHSEPAIGGGFRRRIEDRRRAGGAGLPAVADTG